MDDSFNSKIFLMSNIEMLKALYDFKATFAKTLSFRANDLFLLLQPSMKQRNWWQVVNEHGEIGFVPSNYVQEIDVSRAFLLQFLDDCICRLRNVASGDEKSSFMNGIQIDRHDLIKRLTEKRHYVEQTEQFSKRNDVKNVSEFSATTITGTSIDTDQELPDLKYRTPASPIHKQHQHHHHHNIEEEPIKPIHKGNKTRHSIENIHQDMIKEQQREKSEQLKLQHTAQIDIKPQDVYELVESVRLNTKLSHEMSRVAVTSVISQLQDMLPSNVAPHLSKILSFSQTRLTAAEQCIEHTHDANRLRVIFNELTSCKEDEQQRSWMLYEDETIIVEYISELISILSNADSSICKHVISFDQYHVIFTLVQYYQMETRWSIRQLLLQAFGVMCSLDKTVVSIMLNSVLPMELARDMKTNPRDISKLNYSCLLLTMVFSMGEQMPITHFELANLVTSCASSQQKPWIPVKLMKQLGYDFLVFILNGIECPPETDVDEQIPDLFLNFVLAFNLQFTPGSDNVVLRALADQSTAKIFTEKILLLLNREEDPVRIFEHEPAPPHSLLKLFIDMFRKEPTAALFYTNDVKVLIDIIVRQLSDLSPGDKKRPQYLELCRRMMRNTNYSEHRHRCADIHKCFTRIFCEETEISRNDQQLVRDITNEFPQYFKS